MILRKMIASVRKMAWYAGVSQLHNRDCVDAVRNGGG